MNLSIRLVALWLAACAVNLAAQQPGPIPAAPRDAENARQVDARSGSISHAAATVA